jgi:hypothetical protein
MGVIRMDHKQLLEAERMVDRTLLAERRQIARWLIADTQRRSRYQSGRSRSKRRRIRLTGSFDRSTNLDERTLAVPIRQRFAG